jgi:hypothetical protein
MQRSVLLFALLTISILITAPAQGQARGGGFQSGGGLRISGGAGHGFPSGARRGYSRYRNYGSAFAPWYYPYWDGGWDLPDSSEPPAEGASPSVIVLQSRDDNRQPARVPESPKLIELPDTKDAATSKPDLPTLFVFANGDKLEARRYTLTPDSLRLEIGRQQRTIALDKLNIDATIAANRERGIDLKFPTDENQIFLGF